MLKQFLVILFLPAPHIGSFHASEGPPIQNEQMWAASCLQKMKPFSNWLSYLTTMGCRFFSPVYMGLDIFPPVYREAGCHIGCHSAGSRSVAPLCRPMFGGTFGKDEPDHLFFWRQASNITCFSKVSHQSLYLVIKYIGTIQKLKGLLGLQILARFFFILQPFYTNRQ